MADKSLNRISIFLFCCFLLCLIVFWNIELDYSPLFTSIVSL
jgi:hypothetical protein